MIKDICKSKLIKFQISVLRALQEAAELFLIHKFKIINLLIIHVKQIIIQKRDIQLLHCFRQYITENEM
ncbi:hypothetical protein EMCG_01117 [[Emmonsia] crescens]|uniref:Uncharacterized protein n=1 Tax=[Emmonsia] crescens TaxID=73230 RepID=A0A0G2J5J7_9EURO|nr:hypothetical protein EMCG_01117 [Emmonsia crescens UAMH 3008]